VPTLTLHVSPQAEPFSGSLTDDSGREVEFFGWLGFVSLLEELRQAPEDTH
jgi:hypothetical protein